MSRKLNKAISFTDIHWGAKSNSEVHNQDCLDYIDWFCTQAKKHKADHVIFMGDWFENRNALNVSTMTYAYQGAKKLNDLNIPVYFIIGNHDLYHRHTREIFSTLPYKEFSNFTIINEPTIIEDVEGNPLVCPFLFHNEYPALAEFLSAASWWGHFEFKGFIVTGYSIQMPTGPSHTDFHGPKIFSGHFHKRQITDNVTYIGNVFPTNFSDAGDNNRGLALYDHTTQKTEFINWADCPKYTKVRLTDILDDTKIVHANSRIKCIIDVPISYEESTFLRQKFIDDFQLREFSMEESQDIVEALKDTEIDIDAESIKLDSVDDLVVQMINSIDTPHIENDMLTQIYQQLKV